MNIQSGCSFGESEPAPNDNQEAHYNYHWGSDLDTEGFAYNKLALLVTGCEYNTNHTAGLYLQGHTLAESGYHLIGSLALTLIIMDTALTTLTRIQ